MDGDRTTAVGFHLLPSELLHEILFRLAIPDVVLIRSVSRHLSSLVAGDDFRRLYHLRAAGSGGGWLFVFKKRYPRDAVLRGFNDRSGRWFRIPVAGILSPAIPPGEDLYFLAASGDFFLFASNGRRELVAVNLAARSVRRIPASPLGPRGTASWRRSGLKLISDPPGSDQFRFLFAELQHGSPVLFEYRSDTDTWQSSIATDHHQPPRGNPGGRNVYLNSVPAGTESVVICAAQGSGEPRVFRPRFAGNPALELNTGDRLHVYGDGNVAVVRSVVSEDAGRARARVVVGVELWAMGSDGREWELASRAPEEVMEEGAKKPYGAMMGCLAEREGVVRLILMSTWKGSWDLTWLSYDRGRMTWRWVAVPDCGTKGLNMAGIALSSTFSRLWPGHGR
ncbi:uncharacterized protein [Typha angustifolia]|uniref:uncharacterized protein n=1 Tax=Typha angustifolia TaxID=59011 RepID=UPI003C2D790F